MEMVFCRDFWQIPAPNLEAGLSKVDLSVSAGKKNCHAEECGQFNRIKSVLCVLCAVFSSYMYVIVRLYTMHKISIAVSYGWYYSIMCALYACSTTCKTWTRWNFILCPVTLCLYYFCLISCSTEAVANTSHTIFTWDICSVSKTEWTCTIL